MTDARKRFSQVLITRPQAEAERLAAMLTPLGIDSIVQPAQTFAGREMDAELHAELERLEQSCLLIFTSTRSVDFGLPQIPATVLRKARIAAVGPATAKSLAAAGRRVDVAPDEGYTSEALLEALENDPWVADSFRPASGESRPLALIMCAPGGREKLLSSLTDSGWDARAVWVYDRLAAEISPEAVESICNAERLLSVWTSGQAMDALSQRLPPAAWYAVCRGDWLVMSRRLQRLARAFGPSAVHLSGGPGNADLAAAIRTLVAAAAQ